MKPLLLLLLTCFLSFYTCSPILSSFPVTDDGIPTFWNEPLADVPSFADNSQEEKSDMLEEFWLRGDISSFVRLARSEGNATVKGSDIFVEACSQGLPQVVQLFLPPIDKIEMLYVNMLQTLRDCLFAAINAGERSVLHALQPSYSLGSQTTFYAIELAAKSGTTHLIPSILNMGSNGLHKLACTRGIYEAACAGDLETLRSLVNAFSGSGPLNPLSCAIENGHDAVIDFFLSEANGNLTKLWLLSDGKSPINAAVQTGNVELVKRLLQFPLVKLTCSLSLASESGSLEMVRFIEEYKYKANETCSVDELNLALEKAGSVAVIEYLRNKGDPKLHLGTAGIYEAAASGNVDVLQYYIDQMEPRNSTIYQEAIREAMSRKNAKSTGYLLKAARNLNVSIDKNGLIENAIDAGPRFMGMIFWGEDPADPSFEDNWPFLFAAQMGNVEAMKFLIDLKDPRVDPSVDGNQAIVDAAKADCLACLKYLVSLSESYKAIDPSARKNSAIASAVWHDNFSMLRYSVGLRSRFPGISPADRDNLPIRLARAAGFDHLVAYLVSLSDEFGIDKSYAAANSTEVESALYEYISPFF